MGIVRRDHVITVVAGCNGYNIEPRRFELELSRVQMVDHHLMVFLSKEHRDTDVIDVLLDARAEFEPEDEAENEAVPERC